MATKKEGIEILGEVPMFSKLSKRDLGRLWDRMKVIEHEDGRVIISKGRSGIAFHVVLEGKAKVTRPGASVVLTRGDFFGEISLIDNGPRTADVTAATALVTAALSPSEFKSVAKQQPDMMWSLLEYMTMRLRKEQSTTANMTA